MTHYDRELHIHLFGCLTAEDVWQLGRDRWRGCSQLLKWYEDEYEKSWGRRPNSQQYWLDSANGFDLLKEDFVFASHGAFDRFQACFNLMIALFQVVPGEDYVLQYVLERHLSSGLKYAEYRTVLPARFDKQEIDRYLTSQSSIILASEHSSGGDFIPRLVYSLARDQDVCDRQYGLLKDWMRSNRSLARAIVGIDFSYIEAGHPPISKERFFQKVYADNALDPDTGLAILYHVGESFDTLTIDSAARWVWEAHVLGAHRLGHGIALGIDPGVRLGTIVRESATERRYHLKWLAENSKWLAAAGYTVDLDQITSETRRLATFPPNADALIPAVTPESVENSRRFQDALISDLVTRGAHGESCPTPNFRIGSIKDPAHHPLKRFLNRGCKVCVSTDDPGIFAITLDSEVAFCREKLGISDDQLARIARAMPNMDADSVRRNRPSI